MRHPRNFPAQTASWSHDPVRLALPAVGRSWPCDDYNYDDDLPPSVGLARREELRPTTGIVHVGPVRETLAQPPQTFARASRYCP